MPKNENEIISINVLSSEEYLSVYTADESVEAEIIQSAINDATITLDAICGGMIEKVWEVNDPEDPLYRTEQEHNYIKRAVAIQAHEGVSRNLDFTQGSESYTSGSNNHSETRSRVDVVADDIIYQLLAQARVYNPNIATDTTVSKCRRDLYDPSYDPSQEYITIQTADNRYIHKHAEDTGSYNKFLYYDENGNITYVELGQIILDNFYTKDEVDLFLAEKQYKFIAGNNILIDETDPLHPVISATGEVSVSGEDITNKPNLYTQEEIDDILENYYTSANVDSILLSYQTRTDNTLQTTAKTIVGAINENKSGIDTLETNKQDKTDNNLETTDKTVVGAINENKDRIDTLEEKHLYRHRIHIECDGVSVDSQTSLVVVDLLIFNDSSTAFTQSTLYSRGYDRSDMVSASLYRHAETGTEYFLVPITGISTGSSSSNITIGYWGNREWRAARRTTITQLTDYVEQIF